MILVELEISSIVVTSVVYRTPVWCFVVYETGKSFPWFTGGKLGRIPVKVGSLLINHVWYSNAKDVADPMALEQKQFCQIGNTVYVRNVNDNPLWVYYLPKYNWIIGFTNERPCVRDGVLYWGGVDYVPKITDKADNLEYGRMKFKNENISLINTKGEYDNVAGYFGNNLRIKSEINGALKNLYEYYIKNVKIKAAKATFICGDRRERLGQKVPNERFTLEKFPKIKPELIDDIKQDVYGKCEWVKCVCVDEQHIYIDSNKPITDPNNKKAWRTFYAARKITELSLVDTRPNKNNIRLPNHVWIKQSQPGDGPYDDKEKWPPGTEVWTPCPIDSAHSDLPNGIIAVPILHCMPPWTQYDVPEVYEVRACGTFWTPQDKTAANPFDIIKELLLHYCGLTYDKYWYNQVEMEAEIGGLAPIGIVYDSEASVFEAIEKLQNASDWGFQFKADYNRFTARKDNNERAPVGVIKTNDIINIEDVELDMQQENYATIVDIAYERDYYRESALHYEGKTNRDALLYTHGIDKIYEPETYLVEENDAINKAGRLEQFFRKNRVMINNVEVLNWPDLRVYDIVKIDLRIPLERKQELRGLAMLFDGRKQENVAYGGWPSERVAVDFGNEDKSFRTFGNVLTCKVMGVELNPETGVNTLDLLEVSNG
jgi:hypothetical protein